MRNIMECFPKDMSENEKIGKLSATINSLKDEINRKTEPSCNNVSDNESSSSTDTQNKKKTCEKDTSK